jgi:ArsR family transcriptional regulator
MKNQNTDKFQTAENVSELLKGIAHPIRLMIICHLQNKEVCASDLQKSCGTTLGNISQHLKILTLKNLIKKRKEANRIYYSISDARLGSLIKSLSSLYCDDEL